MTSIFNTNQENPRMQFDLGVQGHSIEVTPDYDRIYSMHFLNENIYNLQGSRYPSVQWPVQVKQPVSPVDFGKVFFLIIYNLYWKM